ncbi:hypothetical protein V1478_015996 [Vespula squamosa]|uniref:Uncharacterized protein n=1 Tax=Vespula squamosa TaxID=30214 RepID=A0ABD2A2E6_VESSQ
MAYIECAVRAGHSRRLFYAQLLRRISFFLELLRAFPRLSNHEKVSAISQNTVLPTQDGRAHSTGIKGRGNKADARIFNGEKSMESIFACRGYFSLRGYPCVRNPKKSRTPYVGKRRAKEEGGSRWKVASERVDGDVPKEGYGISPEFNPYPRCRL